ncbi:MAG: hypothetical protein D6785_14520 [Planctomycetota bacterium]|nr:MAG: hypothetical protein D6785_14520 [Planctomycetota bacterium]
MKFITKPQQSGAVLTGAVLVFAFFLITLGTLFLSSFSEGYSRVLERSVNLRRYYLAESGWAFLQKEIQKKRSLPSQFHWKRKLSYPKSHLKLGFEIQGRMEKKEMEKQEKGRYNIRIFSIYDEVSKTPEIEVTLSLDKQGKMHILRFKARPSL